MEEITIKVGVPSEFKERFELALDRVVKQFIRRLEFSIADDILSKSKLSEPQIFKLSDELKQKVAERHGL